MYILTLVRDLIASQFVFVYCMIFIILRAMKQSVDEHMDILEGFSYMFKEHGLISGPEVPKYLVVDTAR